jgi:hypothetical protein
MHKSSGGALNASIKICGMADIYRLSEEFNTAMAQSADNFSRIIFRGVIVYYFDLHIFRTVALCKYAL